MSVELFEKYVRALVELYEFSDEVIDWSDYLTD